MQLLCKITIFTTSFIQFLHSSGKCRSKFLQNCQSVMLLAATAGISHLSWILLTEELQFCRSLPGEWWGECRCPAHLPPEPEPELRKIRVCQWQLWRSHENWNVVTKTCCSTNEPHVIKCFRSKPSRGKVWILEGIIVSSSPILGSNCLISDLCLQYIWERLNWVRT